MKYRYFITIPFDVFTNLSNICVYELRNHDNLISFYTTKNELKKILSKIKEEDILNIKIVDQYKDIKIKVFKKYLLFILFFIVMFTIMLTSSVFIRGIIFNQDTIYEYEITKTIKEEYKNIGFLNYLCISINDLNKKLRSTYPHFEYIGVSKVGANLVVEITLLNNFNTNFIENNSKGDLIASNNGYIIEIQSSKGIVVVNTSQSVKEGDLLISGNLNLKKDPNDLSNLVVPSGIVLAVTYSYDNIVVNKKLLKKIYNGKITKGINLKIFNKDILKMNEVNEFGHIIYNNIFSLPNIFSLNKYYLYEMEERIIIYTYDDALKYAKSKIEYDFLLNKVHKDEKIIKIELLSYKEYTNSYEFKFLVNKIMNICKLKKYDI